MLEIPAAEHGPELVDGKRWRWCVGECDSSGYEIELQLG
jgi:hypothetical protein